MDGYTRTDVGYGRAAGEVNGYDWNASGYAGTAAGYAGAPDDFAGTAAGYAGAPDDFAGTAAGYAGAPDDFAGTRDGFATDAYLGPGSYTEPGLADPMFSGDPVLTAPDAGVYPENWQADQERRREAGRRGPMVGALMELLATGVVIGVSTLAAALLRAQTSPVSAMGAAFIDRTPAALRNVAVHHFGAHGRTVLLLGMYAAFAVVAIVIGVLARRAAALGVAGIAAFTLFAAFAAITRPAPAGRRHARGHRRHRRRRGSAVAFPRVSADRAAPACASRHPEESTMTTTFDRRKFLTVSGVTAATAVTAGVGGKVLAKRAPANTASKMTAPSATSSSTPTPTPLPATAYKPPPVTESLNIPGISPFYTPNADFYRVDTSLVIPQLSASTWQLRIHGMVDHPMTINFGELMKMPMIEHDITLTCVSEAVGGGYVGNARWQGTLLADVLRKAGIQPGAEQIVMRDGKGMTIGVATEPVMDGRKSLLAVGMNGQVLPQAHGYPVRVVVPGLYGYVSATKWVVDMEFTTFGAFSAYWVKQTPAWSQQAPIKTESRIDVPKRRSTVNAGQVTVAGVAWAQHTGIEAVEVGIDGVSTRPGCRPRTPSTPGGSGTTSGTLLQASTRSRSGPPTRAATPRPG